MIRKCLRSVVMVVTSCCCVLPALADGESSSVVDESVIGIRLFDAESAMRVLGRELCTRTARSESYVIENREATQWITMEHLSGATCGAFGTFRVSTVKPSSSHVTRVKDRAFETEEGIRLGMSVIEVERRLGPPQDRLATDGEEIRLYRIADSGHPFLKQHNMPVYFGRYVFRDAGLVNFEFGFETP